MLREDRRRLGIIKLKIHFYLFLRSPFTIFAAPVFINLEITDYTMKLKTLLAALILFIGCVGTVSAQLPSVKLKDINGKVIDTAKLSNDGKPFIISFFATWCKPCNRELSAINEVYADWQEETGVRVVAISIDEAQNAQKVKPLVDSKGWEFEQVLLDPNSDFRRAMGVNMIPHVFVIDGEGKVAESRSGYTEGGEQHLLEKVRELLKK